LVYEYTIPLDLSHIPRYVHTTSFPKRRKIHLGDLAVAVNGYEQVQLVQSAAKMPQVFVTSLDVSAGTVAQ